MVDFSASIDPLSAVASVFGAKSASSSAKSANRAMQEEAQHSRQFTMDMMRSKHQWEAEDLEAAGLNRVLSLTNGPPIGSSPVAGVMDTNQNTAGMVSSALSSARSGLELKNLKEDTAKKRKEGDAALESAAAATSNAVSQRLAAVAGANSANAMARLNNLTSVQKEALSPAYELGGDVSKYVADKAKQLGKPSDSYVVRKRSANRGYGRGNR